MTEQEQDKLIEQRDALLVERAELLEDIRQLKELSIDSLDLSERSGIVVRMSGVVLPLIADAMMKVFVGAGGKNHVTWTLAASTDTEFAEPYVLTMQRAFGETPAEQLAHRDTAIREAIEVMERLPLDFEAQRALVAKLKTSLVNRPWIPPSRYSTPASGQEQQQP